jgi:hypothetical protein
VTPAAPYHPFYVTLKFANNMPCLNYDKLF